MLGRDVVLLRSVTINIRLHLLVIAATIGYCVAHPYAVGCPGNHALAELLDEDHLQSAIQEAQPSVAAMTTVSGRSIPVSAAQLADGELKVTSGQGVLTFAPQEVSRISMNRERANSSPAPTTLFRIGFVDQSQLVVWDLKGDKDRAAVRIADDQFIDLDISAASWIFVDRTENEGERRQHWSSLLEEVPENADALAVVRGGRWQWLEGRVGSLSPEFVEFAIGQQSAEIRWERIEGLYLMRANRLDVSDPALITRLTNGSEIQTLEFAWRDNTAELTSCMGASIELPITVVDEFDFAGARTVWLTELPPVSLDWSPLVPDPLSHRLRQLNLPTIDRGQNGQPLELALPGSQASGDSRQFERGLAMPGGSKAVFNLNKRYRRLVGWVGLPDVTNVRRVVLLTIQGDDRILFRRELHDEQPPFELELEMDDVSRLVIEVDYADGRSSGDLLYFCDPRLVR